MVSGIHRHCDRYFRPAACRPAARQLLRSPFVMQVLRLSDNWHSKAAFWLAFAACLTSANFARAINDVAGNLITINDNGGWSWFSDERAIVDTSVGAAGKIILSSAA